MCLSTSRRRTNACCKHLLVVVTPHIGGSTAEAATRVSLEVAGEVLAVLDGKPARFAVNAPMVSPTRWHKFCTRILTWRNVSDAFIRNGSVDRWAGLKSNMKAKSLQKTGVLTAAIIKGMLEPVVETRVNLVNASCLAETHGLEISERKTPSRGAL